MIDLANPWFLKGHTACAGCGCTIAIDEMLKALGPDVVVVNATGCMEIVSSLYPSSNWGVPYIHSLFENVGAVASGIARAFKVLGRKGVVVGFSGDGGAYDIGFGALSGAMERNEDVLFVIYDNEAYQNCLSLSSLIMTEEGLKKITDVRIGEMIYAFDQKTCKPVLKQCTGIFDNGSRRVYEVKTLYHSIRATSNHPFLVVERNGRGKTNSFEWKTLAKLKPGDEVIVLKKIPAAGSFKFGPVKLSKKGDYEVTKINQVNLPEASSPELMEYFGMYVGNGWIRQNEAVVGFALPAGSEARERLIQLHSTIFGGRISRSEDYAYINSINLARFIDSVGFGGGARKKLIPGWVFTVPDEEKEAFVRGLLSTDGCTVNGSNRYASASFELLRRLRLLLQTTGYRVGKIHSLKKKAGTLCGYICFSKKRNWNIEKYISQYRYANPLIENEYFDTEKIINIQECGIEPTLDLRVEGEHNFIADGIVVHNTGVQRSGATPLHAATTTSPQEVSGKKEWKKNISFIAAAHGIPYVATASIAFPQDFKNKLKKAKEKKGFRLVTVYANCPIGWRHDSALTIDIAKKAVECGMWHLFEIEDGVFKRSYKPKQVIPVEEYLRLQGRFKHLTPEMIKEIQEHVNKTTADLDRLEGCSVDFRYLE